MKNNTLYIKFIIIALFFIYLDVNAQDTKDFAEQCHQKHDNGGRFIREFPVQHRAVESGSPRVARFNVVLNRGTKYRFYICNDESKPGELILSLYRGSQFLATSYMIDNDRHFPYIEYEVSASGQYSIELMFKDGEEGRGLGVIYSMD